MQVLCGNAVRALEAAFIVIRRPYRVRDWPNPADASAGLKTETGAPPSIRSSPAYPTPLDTKSVAALTAINAAIAADNRSACLVKRRTQCCPRWQGDPGAATFQA